MYQINILYPLNRCNVTWQLCVNKAEKTKAVLHLKSDVTFYKMIIAGMYR